MLLFLMLVLITPYLLLTLAGRVTPKAWVAPAARGKVSLTAFLLVTSSGHFVSPAAMAEMLPPFVPYRTEIIYVTGIFEVLAAIGIWVPSLTRLTGFLLIVMLIGILPSNIYSAFARVPFGGHEYGPVYLLVRIPFQLLVIAWTYFATGQEWLRHVGRPGSSSRGEGDRGASERGFFDRAFVPGAPDRPNESTTRVIDSKPHGGQRKV